MSLGPVNRLHVITKKSFADIIKVTDLKIEKLSWILLLGPNYSREPLKDNDCLHLQCRKMCGSRNTRRNSQTEKNSTFGTWKTLEGIGAVFKFILRASRTQYSPTQTFNSVSWNYRHHPEPRCPWVSEWQNCDIINLCCLYMQSLC